MYVRPVHCVLQSNPFVVLLNPATHKFIHSTIQLSCETCKNQGFIIYDGHILCLINECWVIDRAGTIYRYIDNIDI